MRRKVSDHPESFQTIRKVSRPSGNFLDHPESFQTIRKLSRPSGNLCIWACLLMVDFIDTRKNFPDAQKLSRWQCHHETWVFLTLLGPPNIPTTYSLLFIPNESVSDWNQNWKRIIEENLKMLTNSRMVGRDGQAGAAPKPKDGRDRKVHIFHSAANPFFLFH